MGQFLTYENVLLLASSATTSSTSFTTHPYNGTLRQVTITTGGVGSSGSTAWMGSSTATTNSSGIGSTSLIVFYSEKTGAKFLSVNPPGAGGATYYPLTGGHSSSGALINAMSTAPFFAYPFPLADDRLAITTNDITVASNGYCHTIKLIFEGSRY